MELFYVKVILFIKRRMSYENQEQIDIDFLNEIGKALGLEPLEPDYQIEEKRVRSYPKSKNKIKIYKRGKRGLPQQFPTKLFKILENKDNNDIIRWNKDGKTFVIIDEHKLEEEILPQYFISARLDTFVRQLNIYGFHKIPKGKWVGSYEHKQKKFRRNCVDCCKYIIRNF